jgi:SOS-response transcriptional repressor LexA
MTTERQFEVLAAMRKAEQSGLPPTYADLCQIFGWQSYSSARDHIRALARQKLIVRDERHSKNTSRPWRVTDAGRRLVEAWRDREAAGA